MSVLIVALGVVSTGIVVLVAELSKNFFIAEAQTRLERLPMAILRLARQRLAASHRSAVYEDEWLPELEFIARETGGLPITRLVRSLWFAIGLLWSARSISAVRGGWEDTGAGHALGGQRSTTGLPAAFAYFLHRTALTVRAVLSDCPDARVVSVVGSWGSGKTSVLETTQLVGLDHGTTDSWFNAVPFNPWHLLHERIPNVSIAGELECVVAEATCGQSRPVVVFVDDLDRCDPQTVFTLLNALRFVGSHLRDAQLRFVLAFDPDVVVAALDQSLAPIADSSGSSGTVPAGRAFLEKVIQVPIRIPLPPRPLRGSQ